MSKIYRYDGSTFDLIEDGTKIYYHNGTSFVNPSTVSVYNNNAWTTIWNKSDPVTINTSVAQARHFRRSDGTGSMVWDPLGDGYARIGRFSSGQYDMVGVYKMDNALFALAAGGRTVVKQASFTVRRDADVGSSSFTDPLYLGIYRRSTSISPLYTSLDFSPNAAWNRTWTWNTTYTWDLDATGLAYAQDLADDLIANGTVNIAISGATSGWDVAGSGFDDYYSRFEGPTTGYTGTLSITLDYI